MQILILALIGSAVWGIVALLCRRHSFDLGSVPWSNAKADKAAEDTERWFGRSWETARLVEPWALTTKEWQRMADQAAVAEREERLAQMSRGKFRMVG